MACCTIEKANVAINRLAQEGRLGKLDQAGLCAAIKHLGRQLLCWQG